VLNGDKTFSLTQKKFKVSDALKTGEAAALFGALNRPIGYEGTY
jgi:hexokinase